MLLNKKLINENFLKQIPKTDLHVHLDGSIRIETLIELAKKKDIFLPSYTEGGLRELVFKERYHDLNEYLAGFAYTVAVLQDSEALERVAYEIAWDNINEGVYYLELRFAPQLHIHPDFEIVDVLKSVYNGLERASSEFNQRSEVLSGKIPPFHYGIIVCAMRKFTASHSYYFKHFLKSLQFSTFKSQTGLASLELARAVVKIRDEYHLPIVGFDLAGQEDGYPALDHKLAFQYAHQNFLKKTVHAGEAYGPESIFQAITELYADRLGHAYHLFSKEFLQNIKDEEKKEQYIQALSQYIAARRITIEVCLTSNLQTLPFLDSFKHHSFNNMLKNGLSVTLCTDNRTISDTTVTNEILHAVKNFPITVKQLKNMVIYGFKRSFFSGTYTEKRKYVRKIIDYYESLEEKFEISENKSSKDCE